MYKCDYLKKKRYNKSQTPIKILPFMLILCFILFSVFILAGEYEKEKPIINYTPTTDTICYEGVCNLIMYSSIRNVYENEGWKRVEDARSLLNAGYNIQINIDKDYPIKVVDFNYTSITVDLGSGTIEGNIPIRIWKYNESKVDNLETSFNYKDSHIKTFEDIETFGVVSFLDKRRTYDYGIGDVLEYGHTSSEVIISGATNVDDALIYSSAGDGNFGGRADIVIGRFGGAGLSKGLVRYRNIASEVGSNKVIDNAEMYLNCFSEYVSTNYDVNAYRAFKPWVEGNENGANDNDGDVTNNDWSSDTYEWGTTGADCAGDDGVDNSQDGTCNSAGRDRNATAEDTTSITVCSNTWHSWNITDLVRCWYSGDCDENGVIMINANAATANSGKTFRSTESGTNTPYLNITYSEGVVPEYPQFSNYWDNNATVVNSGIGLFNVTLLSTNGTVWLEIDGDNYTASNVTASVYNASHSFTLGGDYTYRWHSWGNGTNEEYNVSIDQIYTVNSSIEVLFQGITDINSTIKIRKWSFINVTSTSNVLNCSIDFNGTIYYMNNKSASSWYYNITNIDDGKYYYNVTCNTTTDEDTSENIWVEIYTPSCNNDGICSGKEDIESCPLDCFEIGTTIQELLNWSEFQNYTLRETDWVEINRSTWGSGVTIIHGSFSTGFFTTINGSNDIDTITLDQVADIFLPPNVENLEDVNGWIMPYHTESDILGGGDSIDKYLIDVCEKLNISIIKHGEKAQDWEELGFPGRDHMTKVSFLYPMRTNDCKLTDPITSNFILYLGKTSVMAGTILENIVKEEGSKVSDLSISGGSKEGYAVWLVSSVDDRIMTMGSGYFPMEEMISGFETYAENSGCGEDEYNTDYNLCIATGPAQMTIRETEEFTDWMKDTPAGQEWYNLFSTSSQISTFYPTEIYLDGDNYACGSHDGNYFTPGMDNVFLSLLSEDIEYRYNRASKAEHLSGYHNVKRIYNMGKLINDQGDLTDYPTINTVNITTSGTTSFVVNATISNSTPVDVYIWIMNLTDLQVDLPKNNDSWFEYSMTYDNGIWTSGVQNVVDGEVAAWYVLINDTVLVTGNSTVRTDSSPVEYAFPTANRNCEVDEPVSCSKCNNQSIWLHLDQNASAGESSSLVYDWSGNGNNGTIYGASVTTGFYDNSYNFDGVNDFMTFGTNESLDLNTGDMGISFWIRPSTDLTSSHDKNMTIFGKINSTDGWSIRHTAPWFVGIEPGFFLTMRNGGSTLESSHVEMYSQFNTWYQVIINIDRDKNVSFYIDGTLIHTYDISSFDSYDISYFGNFTMGKQEGEMDSDAIFPGIIDEFLIYNRLLTSTEIWKISNEGLLDCSGQNIPICNLTNAFWGQNTVAHKEEVGMFMTGTYCGVKYNPFLKGWEGLESEIELNYSIYQENSNEIIDSFTTPFNFQEWIALWSYPFDTEGGLGSRYYEFRVNRLDTPEVIYNSSTFDNALEVTQYNIEFVSPTHINEPITSNPYFNISTSSAQKNCSLNFNGTEYWMNNYTDSSWYYEITSYTNGIYYYNVTCSDSSDNQETTATVWLRANSSIDVSIVTPSDIGITTNVSQNEFFNVTLNVSCSGETYCGEVNVSLDPFWNGIEYQVGDLKERGANYNEYYTNTPGKYKRILYSYDSNLRNDSGEYVSFNEVVDVYTDNGNLVMSYNNGQYSVSFQPIFVMNGQTYNWSEIPSFIEKNLWRNSYEGYYKYGVDFNNVSTYIKENLDFVVLHRSGSTGLTWDDVKKEGNSLIIKNKIEFSHDDILVGFTLPVVNKTDIVIGNLTDNFVSNGDGTWNLTIDPTINVQPNPTVGIDTYLSSGNADTNYGDSASSFQIGVEGSDNIGRLLIKFTNASDIPAGSTCDSAELDLYSNYLDGSGPNQPSSVYELRSGRSGWVEMEATWNIYSSGNSWTTGGAGSTTSDILATAIGTFNTPASASNWVNISLTCSDVEDWFGGDENYGMMIRQDAESSGWSKASFRSSDYTSHIEQRPRLVIEYTEAITSKSGLINTTIGAIPFYTNESNPRNITLGVGESQLVVFWVNATGDLDSEHTFFGYVNNTNDLSINNITDEWNVGIISGGDIYNRNVAQGISSLVDVIRKGFGNRISNVVTSIGDTFNRMFDGIKEITDNILNTITTNRIGRLFKDLIQLLNLDDFLSTMRDFRRDISDTFDLNTITGRLLLVLKLPLLPLTLSDKINAGYTGIRQTTQDISIDASVNRLSNLFRNPSQLISFTEVLDRIFFRTESISDSFFITENMERAYGGLRTPTQIINFDIIQDRLQVLTIGISDTINFIIDTIRNFFGIIDVEDTIAITDKVNGTYIDIGTPNLRNVSSSFLIEDSIDRLFLSIRHPTQLININLITDRITFLTKDFLDNINFEIIVDRLFLGLRETSDSLIVTDTTQRTLLGLRTPSQIINFDIIQDRLQVLTIGISDTINFIIDTIRNFFGIIDVEDTITITDDVNGTYIDIGNIFQGNAVVSFSIEDSMSRFGDLIRQPTHVININLITDRIQVLTLQFYDTITFIVDSFRTLLGLRRVNDTINIGDTINTTYVSIGTTNLRNISDSFNIGDSITRLNNLIRQPSQFISFSIIQDRLQVLTLNFYEAINIEATAERIRYFLVNIFQTINIILDAFRSVFTPSTVVQSPGGGGGSAVEDINLTVNLVTKSKWKFDRPETITIHTFDNNKYIDVTNIELDYFNLSGLSINQLELIHKDIGIYEATVFVNSYEDVNTMTITINATATRNMLVSTDSMNVKVYRYNFLQQTLFDIKEQTDEKTGLLLVVIMILFFISFIMALIIILKKRRKRDNK